MIRQPGTRWGKEQDILGVHRVEEPYAAMVTYDDGPGTDTKVALLAEWCQPTEARGHVERRLPELYVELGLRGKRVQAMVCSARTQPVRAVTNAGPDWTRQLLAGGAQFANIRDGKVIDWSPAPRSA